jgi:hypothetical protein
VGELDHEDRERCELLLFPERLRIDRFGKVSTPKISPIYRYEATKKIPSGASNSLYGDPYPKKLAPYLCEFERWYALTEKQYKSLIMRQYPRRG